LYIALQGLWDRSYEKVFLSSINGSKKVARTWKMMKEVVIRGPTELMKMLQKCRLWYIQIDIKYQSYGFATGFGQRNSKNA